MLFITQFFIGKVGVMVFQEYPSGCVDHATLCGSRVVIGGCA